MLVVERSWASSVYAEVSVLWIGYYNSILIIGLDRSFYYVQVQIRSTLSPTTFGLNHFRTLISSLQYRAPSCTCSTSLCMAQSNSMVAYFLAIHCLGSNPTSIESLLTSSFASSHRSGGSKLELKHSTTEVQFVWCGRRPWCREGCICP